MKMDGYDVLRLKNPTYCVYKYEKPNEGKQIKVYKFGYPDYKSMIKKHPELK